MSQPHTLCHLVLKVSVCDILSNVSQKNSTYLHVNQKLVLFTGSLSVDQHLKMVREATWDVRSKWRLFGLELGIDMSTLDVSILFYSAVLTANYGLFLVHRQLNVIAAMRLVIVSLVCWSSG